MSPNLLYQIELPAIFINYINHFFKMLYRMELFNNILTLFKLYQEIQLLDHKDEKYIQGVNYLLCML